MKKIYHFLSIVILTPSLFISKVTLAADNITLCGDSTVATYTSGPIQGWGSKLPGHTALGVKVLNRAKGGTSTTTFLSTGLWKNALADKSKFIFIQFGQNDESHNESVAGTTYKSNLQRMINDAKKQNSIAVLVTPPHRLRYIDTTHLSTELAPYAQAMKEVAAQNKIPLIDLYTSTGNLYLKIGEKAALKYFNAADTARTHTNSVGADILAKMVADMAKLNSQLKSLFK